MNSCTLSLPSLNELLARGIYTIPAGQPFAQDLAAGILASVQTPEQLAKMKILLPSRRAAQGLKTAFIQQAKGQALFLPDMQPIGDVDELDSGFLSQQFQADDLSELLPAVSLTDRQMILARLIQSRPVSGQPLSAAQAFRLAASLARFLDQIYQSGGNFSDLKEADIPAEFARHWAEILTFLGIVLRNWPEITKEIGVMDPSVRRLALLDIQLQNWSNQPPQTPVILAGSTGSLPKTVALMRAVRALPAGLLVFPGHDGTLVSTDDLNSILGDVGHPLHQLFTTFSSLDVTPDKVPVWPACSSQPVITARTALMRQVLLPAEQTAQWRQIVHHHPEVEATALTGLRLIEADDTHHEASIIACLMRETLETPEKTAMLVTPDRQLARQVRAALLKWGLNVDDSAGVPLPLTRIGHYLQLIAEWANKEGSAHALLALIKHPLACGGLPAAQFRQLGRLLERQVLRGYLHQNDREGIAKLLVSDPKLHHLKLFYEQNILAPLLPVTEAFARQNTSFGQLADAHARAAEQLAQTDKGNASLQALWSSEDGKVAAQLLDEIISSDKRTAVQACDYTEVFHVLSRQQTVRSVWQSHPRLAILGTVEARMQSADNIILSSLNEGSWPPAQDYDPWTNQTIRTALKLPDRRWRAGLSAHDFLMQVCTPEVTMTRARRADDSPTTPSRWLERLKAVLVAAQLTETLMTGIPASVKTALTSHLSQPVKAFDMPAPHPEIALRPRQFSATEFDHWISDPYFIYAKKILKLKPLDPVDRRPDAALRGTLTHRVLAAFVEKYPAGPLPANAKDTLYRLGEEAFAPYFGYPPIKVFWLARFKLIADWFIEHEASLRQTLKHSYAELKGRISLDAPNGPVIVTATADRLDIQDDDTLSIIDYKTGPAPTKAKVARRRATQLLVEAIIAQAGGFTFKDNDQPQGFRELSYWQLSGSYERAARVTPVLPDEFDADEDRKYLEELIAKYDTADQPYLPEPSPHDRPTYSDYRHLSRVREWRPHEVDDD
jgi:ATP-dependent helicase/nuclease subunit B